MMNFATKKALRFTLFAAAIMLGGCAAEPVEGPEASESEAGLGAQELRATDLEVRALVGESSIHNSGAVEEVAEVQELGLEEAPEEGLNAEHIAREGESVSSATSAWFRWRSVELCLQSVPRRSARLLHVLPG